MKKLLYLLFFIVILLLIAPFMLTIAGDGQVHLAVAENFTVGRPFQYNPNGEIVVASTSPFWTIMLIGFYASAGANAPILLKIVGLMAWLLAALLLHRIAKEQWQLPPMAQLAVVGLWLGHTTVFANALNGLENVLAAFQLVLLAYLTTRFLDSRYWGHGAILGALVGWMLLTRPDTGMLGVLVLGLFWLRQLWYARGQFPSFLLSLGCFVAAAVLVLAQWYVYQYSVTGQAVTDSSVARLYTGRQGSLILIPDRLYLHPKAFISLMTAFLPVTVCAAWTAVLMTQRRIWAELSAKTWFAQITAVLLLVASFIFYTFVVGAEAFGRYYLPLYPFLFLAGVWGFGRLASWVGGWWPQLVKPFIVLTILFMVATSGFDYYRRVFNGRAPTEQILDVIYGPAHKQYFAFNLQPILDAPKMRQQNTDALLAALQASADASISFAVTEVQLRYFVDERVEILSLDGRTSANILDYFDSTTGVPNFERFLLDARPDYVHVNQWCEVGGFLADFVPFAIEGNLICMWQQGIEQMEIGGGFEWNGRSVTLVAPEIVRIDWE